MPVVCRWSGVGCGHERNPGVGAGATTPCAPPEWCRSGVVSNVGGWVFTMGMRGYRWTAEQAAELAESMLRFNRAADAEMAAKGYRPGAGLPFQGMRVAVVVAPGEDAGAAR